MMVDQQPPLLKCATRKRNKQTHKTAGADAQRAALRSVASLRLTVVAHPSQRAARLRA